MIVLEKYLWPRNPIPSIDWSDVMQSIGVKWDSTHSRSGKNYIPRGSIESSSRPPIIINNNQLIFVARSDPGAPHATYFVFSMRKGIMSCRVAEILYSSTVSTLPKKRSRQCTLTRRQKSRSSTIMSGVFWKFRKFPYTKILGNPQ